MALTLRMGPSLLSLSCWLDEDEGGEAEGDEAAGEEADGEEAAGEEAEGGREEKPLDEDR